MTAAPVPGAVYPVAPKDGDNDSRFTHGLLFDVVNVLESHGYPKFVSGSDLVELRQTLYRFLYTGKG